MRKRNDYLRCFAGVALSVIMAFAYMPFFSAQDNAVYAADERMAGYHGTGGIDENIPAMSIDESGVQSHAALPSKYDSRTNGYVTPVRDQGGTGLCWSFATIGAVESSLLAHKQVASANNLNLSERQLAYFTFNTVADRLGNTAGDKTVPTTRGRDFNGSKLNNYILNGGNQLLTTNIMASGIGVTSDDIVSTDELVELWDEEGWYWSKGFNKMTKLSPELARDANVWTLSAAKRIDMKQMDLVKQAVMDYGGVATKTYLETGYDGGEIDWDEDISWNTQYCAYYNYGYDDYANHEVLIVGWNDNFSKEKFRDSYDSDRCIPENNGAWLVKNSWGKYWGNDGYYWLSYEDAYLVNNEYAIAYAYDMKPADNSEILYQYDGSTGDYFNYIKSGGSIANMFEVNGADGQDEELQSVSFTSLADTEVNYSLQIYTNCKNGKPTSGDAALASPQTGKTSYQGIYTIDLNKKIPLEVGSTYSVVLTLSHDNGKKVKYDVDASSHNTFNWVRFESKVLSKQSFEKNTKNAKWHDLSRKDNDKKDEPQCAARVKAVTKAIAKPYAESYVESFKVAKGKKSFTAKWMKQSPENQELFDGYQIRYSQKADMSKAKYKKAANSSASLKVKKLKAKKKYYVQARTFTIKDGVTYYSEWSEIKAVKTK